MELLKEILSFCRECEGFHFFNDNNNSEIYHCPRLEMLAVRKVNDCQSSYWLMRAFNKSDFLKSAEGAKELLRGVEKEMFKKFGASA
jgi:hypothetical protein